jgi:hypothetical protein
MKSNKNSKTSNVETKQGPGRPKYEPTIPRKTRFTFQDFMAANGVNPETGKGEKCSKLTLNNWMKRNEGKNSPIVRLKGISAKPNSETGLGRKQFVFCKRADYADQQAAIDLVNDAKAAKAAAKPIAKVKAVKVKATKVKATPVSVNVGQGKTYDEVKAALLAPSPAVTVPVVDITPVAPVTEPTVTPVEAAPVAA